MYAFRKKANVYGQEFLAPRPTPTLKVHLLSNVGERFGIGGRFSIRNLKTCHLVVNLLPRMFYCYFLKL